MHFNFAAVNIYFRTALLICTGLFSIGPPEISASESFAYNTNPYRHFRTLDDEGKYKLEWLVDLPGKRVTFNVTAETRGYVGFGLSKKGMMDGADIVMGGVMPNGRPYFSDKHTTRHLPPVQDKSQDWTLHAASESQTHTFLSFSRAFETCDEEEDLLIHGDVIGLIWAFGERDIEIDYHYQNRGSSFAYLLDPDLTPHGVMANQLTDPELFDTDHIDRWLLKGSQLLPSKETTYICSIFKAPYHSRRHIIGFNTILPTDADRKHIHHYVMHRCHAPEGQTPEEIFQPVIEEKDECYLFDQPTGRIPAYLCTEVVHIWAVGQLPNFLPAHAGISVMDEYYMLQVHFDNPNQTRETELNYSLEIFSTDEIREHDASLLLVGELNPASPSILVPPNSLSHHVYGHCGAGCTQRMIPESGIKVFAFFLHTHLAGRGVRLVHVRGNREVGFIGYDDNYNFNFQQIHLLSEEVVLLPGDTIVVRCEMENADRSGRVTIGGFSTRDEMCTGTFWYYDKMANYNLCRSVIREPEYLDFLQIYNTTWSNERIERVVQSPPENAGLTVSEVGNYRIDWTIENRRKIQEYHRYLPQFTQCPTITTSPRATRSRRFQNGWTPGISHLKTILDGFGTPASSYNQNQLGYENKNANVESEFISIFPRDLIPYERPSQCRPSRKQLKSG